MSEFRQFIYLIAGELIDAAQTAARDGANVAYTLNRPGLEGHDFLLRLCGATTTPATVPGSNERPLIAATPKGGHSDG